MQKQADCDRIGRAGPTPIVRSGLVLDALRRTRRIACRIATSCPRQDAVLFVLALIASYGGYRWGHSRLVAPLSGEGLSIASAYLDFGAATVQEDFLWKAPIENLSSHAVEVVGFERSCGCATVTPNSFTLAPGETQWLQIHLNLRSRDAFTFSGGEREFSVSLRPLVAKAMTPGAPWVVHGRVQSPFRIVEPKLCFPTGSLVAGREFEPLAFTLTPRAPIQDLTVALAKGSAAAEVSVEPRGSAWRISLRPDAALAVGVHDFRVVIAATALDGVPLPRQTVRLTGRVVPDVTVEPPYLRFDGRAASVQAVRLHSRTGAPFEVVDVAASNPLLRVDRGGDDRQRAAEADFDVAALRPSTELLVAHVEFRIRSTNDRAGEFSLPLQVVLHPEANP